MKSFRNLMFVAAAFLAAASPAMAADTVKGINQNNIQETVGTKHIFAVHSVGGVLYYRSQIGGGTTYSLSDANGSQAQKALAAFGTGNALQAANGWTYDLGKVKVICASGSTSVIAIAGVSNADYLSDNCAFATAANNL